jgi:hypothetical protein
MVFPCPWCSQQQLTENKIQDSLSPLQFNTFTTSNSLVFHQFSKVDREFNRGHVYSLYHVTVDMLQIHSIETKGYVTVDMLQIRGDQTLFDCWHVANPWIYQRLCDCWHVASPWRPKVLWLLTCGKSMETKVYTMVFPGVVVNSSEMCQIKFKTHFGRLVPKFIEDMCVWLLICCKSMDTKYWLAPDITQVCHSTGISVFPS